MIQNVSFEIPLKFLKGLENGTFERYGGIIRDSAGKKVRGWLKEVPSQDGMNSKVASQLSSISSSLQFTNALQIANIGVSIAGFAMLAIKLNKISNQIIELTEQVKEVKEITLMNQKINLFQIVSHYQNFEYQEVISNSNSEEVRFIDAISNSLKQSMHKHNDLVIMGQDIAEYGGAFKITEGFVEQFGKGRVRNTPICESAIVEAAMGLSIAGIKSVVEMQFADFVSSGFNPIVN